MVKETSLSKQEILELLEDPGKLFPWADYVRMKYCGNSVYIRGIIEFSNYCIRDCLYCGLRRENDNLCRYRMTPDEITGLARKIYREGVKTIVLQSGDDPGFTREILSEVITKIKLENPGVAVTLSIGERPNDDYKAFREAGADRYLLKHETANPSLYEQLHPGQSLKKRIEIIEYLKKLGYEIGSGNIIGLPKQSVTDLVNDVLLFKSLDVDMVGIGPFIPQRDTPLSEYPCGDFRLTMKAIALTRIVTQNTNIPATTALASVNPNDGQLLGLKTGCNVIMPDFTPEQYRKNYAIYDNKAKVNLEEAKEVIVNAQRAISFDRGDTLKRIKAEPPMAVI